MRRYFSNKSNGKTLRKSGIDVVGNIHWGTHLCQFYKTKEDLVEILVPFFKTGLENNEFCMWVVSEPLGAEDAKAALKKEVPNLEDYLKKNRIEIINYEDCYTKSGKFDADKVLQGWAEKEKEALRKGFDGLRVTGNTFWLREKDRKAFDDYERTVNEEIGKHKMLVICSYSLDKCGAADLVDVISSHQFSLIKRQDAWKLVENSEHKKAQTEIISLARFPYENPSPVLRVAKDGEILYSNEAGFSVLNQWKTQIGEKAPERWIRIIKEKFEIKELQEEEEEEVNGKIFSFKVIPVKDAGYANLYGRNITEYKKSEESLRQSDLKLREQNLSLEQKNLALKEMIEHIERSKNSVKEDITKNVNETVLPILEKLKIKGVSSKYIDLLRRHLENITSSFGRKITQKSSKLTPKEIEVSSMLKGGLTTKEISALLYTSGQTIEKHRKNIRKKLGLSNKKINLTSYLQNF